MENELIIPDGSGKEEIYAALIPQIVALTETEEDLVANLANVSAALFQTFGFLWVGFYLVKNNQLVLGPFQGPVACTRIQYGKGVCGTSWQRAQRIVVPDVEAFPGHIACCSKSKSEIVVPVIQNNEVVAVLDIDSCEYGTFDETDNKYLSQVCDILTDKF